MENVVAIPLVAAAYGTECSYCSNAVDRSNLKACGACKRAHYCNITCQTNDWKKKGKFLRFLLCSTSDYCMAFS